VRLKTSDNVEIDGMYLDAGAFLRKLGEGGGKLATIRRSTHSGKEKSYQGIAFDREA
jgi:hypothetical protein